MAETLVREPSSNGVAAPSETVHFVPVPPIEQPQPENQFPTLSRQEQFAAERAKTAETQQELDEERAKNQFNENLIAEQKVHIAQLEGERSEYLAAVNNLNNRLATVEGVLAQVTAQPSEQVPQPPAPVEQSPAAESNASDNHPASVYTGNGEYYGIKSTNQIEAPITVERSEASEQDSAESSAISSEAQPGASEAPVEISTTPVTGETADVQPPETETDPPETASLTSEQLRQQVEQRLTASTSERLTNLRSHELAAERQIAQEKFDVIDKELQQADQELTQLDVQESEVVDQAKRLNSPVLEEYREFLATGDRVRQLDAEMRNKVTQIDDWRQLLKRTRAELKHQKKVTGRELNRERRHRSKLWFERAATSHSAGIKQIEARAADAKEVHKMAKAERTESVAPLLADRRACKQELRRLKAELEQTQQLRNETQANSQEFLAGLGNYVSTTPEFANDPLAKYILKQIQLEGLVANKAQEYDQAKQVLKGIVEAQAATPVTPDTEPATDG